MGIVDIVVAVVAIPDWVQATPPGFRADMRRDAVEEEMGNFGDTVTGTDIEAERDTVEAAVVVAGMVGVQAEGSDSNSASWSTGKNRTYPN